LKPETGSRKSVKCIAVLLVFSCILFCCVPKSAPPPANSYRINDRLYHPLPDAFGFRQQGIASWYGDPFHGRKTANGETYNMHAMTAAHKTLPFGTMVQVRNLDNHKTAIVRINDRGPFVRERIIDLSYNAARAIGLIQNGTAPVEIIALGTDDDLILNKTGTSGENLYFTGEFTIQVGAFADRTNAERLKTKLEKRYSNVAIDPFIQDNACFYRVRVGLFTSLKQAKSNEQRMIEEGFTNAFTVARH
jgi:rare lipoprotein A